MNQQPMGRCAIEFNRRANTILHAQTASIWDLDGGYQMVGVTYAEIILDPEQLVCAKITTLLNEQGTPLRSGEPCSFEDDEGEKVFRTLTGMWLVEQIGVRQADSPVCADASVVVANGLQE